MADMMLRLREALVAAGYTYDGVAGLLGPTAHAALSRNETLPGLRVTEETTPLATLTRLWLLQASVDLHDARDALPGLVDRLSERGILGRSGRRVRARVDVRPYADENRDWWVLSDLTPGMGGRGQTVSSDHVLGISSASTSLAQLTVREKVERALDLGTGCGVQSLHLTAHADHVVATDVNERALWIAGLNAELNGVSLDLREGNLFEPVSHERFDLVVSNPPFVISAATDPLLVYRDSGLPGDEVVRRVVTGAPGLLRPGGWAQVLANWSIVAGQPWEERLASWVEGSGCDVWVVQREVLDPAQYVELWLKDSGIHGTPDYPQKYDEWLSWFEEQHIEAIGFGWINLRRLPDPWRTPSVRFEEWRYEVEQPIGEEILDWSRRTDLSRVTDDAALLGMRLVRRVDVRQESFGEPGAADPEQIVLRQQRGMRRARQVDTVEAGLFGACDGDLSIGQILVALGSLLGRDPNQLRSAYLPAVRELLVEGFLTPPSGGA